MTPEQRKELEEKLKKMSPGEIAELQKQQCIFCQLLVGKFPTHKIYEDDLCVAILDKFPAVKGHMLLIPKEHIAIMPQVPEKVLNHLFVVAKALSKILLKALKVTGTNIFVANGLAAGQRTTHFVIHIIPRKEGDELLKIDDKILPADMMGKIKLAIQDKLNQLLGVKEEVQHTLKEEKEETVEEEKEDFEDNSEEPEEVIEEITEEVEEVIEEDDSEPDEEDKYITSATAKRYHKSTCAFAQNITKEKRIHWSKEEAEESSKKPCTCITGKKIPLKKEDEVEPEEVADKPKKKKAKKQEAVESKGNKKKEVELDDIADLFK